MGKIRWCVYRKNENDFQSCIDCEIKGQGQISLQNYEDCLLKRGYSELTPSNRPSTVPLYVDAVSEIRNMKKFTVKELVDNISQTVKEFDVGGKFEKYGEIQNRTWRNALKRFEEYVQCKLWRNKSLSKKQSDTPKGKK